MFKYDIIRHVKNNKEIERENWTTDFNVFYCDGTIIGFEFDNQIHRRTLYKSRSGIKFYFDESIFYLEEIKNGESEIQV